MTLNQKYDANFRNWSQTILNIKIEKRVYDVTVTLILIVEKTNVKFGFRDPKYIIINTRIVKNNSTFVFAEAWHLAYDNIERNFKRPYLP